MIAQRQGRNLYVYYFFLVNVKHPKNTDSIKKCTSNGICVQSKLMSVEINSKYIDGNRNTNDNFR